MHELQRRPRTRQRRYAQPPVVQARIAVTWTPGDGDTYHLEIWPTGAASGDAFVVVGRADGPLVCALLAFAPFPTFRTYVDRFVGHADMDVQLLWAGWRALCALTALPDPVPPTWLPAWRADWSSDLPHTLALGA